MQFTDLDPATCGSGESAMTAWYDMALSSCVEVAVDTKILAKQDWSGAGVKGGGGVRLKRERFCFFCGSPY